MPDASPGTLQAPFGTFHLGLLNKARRNILHISCALRMIFKFKNVIPPKAFCMSLGDLRDTIVQWCFGEPHKH